MRFVLHHTEWYGTYLKTLQKCHGKEYNSYELSSDKTSTDFEQTPKNST